MQKEGLYAFKAGATGDATVKSPITIKTPPKVYRRKQESQYMGPELGDDLLDGNWVSEELGRSLKKKSAPLPPRDDIAVFETSENLEELERNIRLGGCPENLHGRITSVVKAYWDIFAEGGLQKPIRGFSFQVDTGSSKPVCCKPPRYGKHEVDIMRRLVAKMEDNEESHI